MAQEKVPGDGARRIQARLGEEGATSEQEARGAVEGVEIRSDLSANSSRDFAERRELLRGGGLFVVRVRQQPCVNALTLHSAARCPDIHRQLVLMGQHWWLLCFSREAGDD